MRPERVNGFEQGRIEQGERGGTAASQVKCVVREDVGWLGGTFEGTRGIFNTGIDHREVLTRGFQRLCYSLLVMSSATGAEVEKSTSVFKTTHHFGTTGSNLTFFVSHSVSVSDFELYIEWS